MNGVRGNSRAAAWIVGAVALGSAFAFASTWTREVWSTAAAQAAVALVGVGASSRAAREWLTARARARGTRRCRVLLVGNGPVAEHLAHQAEEKGFHVLGTVEDLDPEARLDWPE